MTNRRDFYEALWSHVAGDRITLKVLRGGNELLDLEVATVDRGVFYGESKAAS